MLGQFLGNMRREPPFQVGAGAEGPPRAGQDDDLDAVVDVEHREDRLEVLHHLIGEGIVLFGAVQGDDHHGRGCRGAGGVVGDFDMGCLDGFVGGGDLDGRWIGDHCDGFFWMMMLRMVSSRRSSSFLPSSPPVSAVSSAPSRLSVG